MMETRARSIAKGLTWRALAMADTVLLALIFTGSFRLAAAIGGIELVTKLVWYYIHERVWLRIPAAHPRYPKLERWLGHETQTRSFLKAVSWRFWGALDTFVITLLVTGKFAVSGSIGGTELITKICLYYLHERAWSHLHWGSAGHAALEQPGASRIKNFFDVLRRYYRLSKAAAYLLACVLFIIASAAVVYALHVVL